MIPVGSLNHAHELLVHFIGGRSLDGVVVAVAGGGRKHRVVILALLDLQHVYRPFLRRHGGPKDARREVPLVCDVVLRVEAVAVPLDLSHGMHHQRTDAGAKLAIDVFLLGLVGRDDQRLHVFFAWMRPQLVIHVLVLCAKDFVVLGEHASHGKRAREVVVAWTIRFAAPDGCARTTAAEALQLRASRSSLFHRVHEATGGSQPGLRAPECAHGMDPVAVSKRQKATHSRNLQVGIVADALAIFDARQSSIVIAAHVAQGALPRILPLVVAAVRVRFNQVVPATQRLGKLVLAFCVPSALLAVSVCVCLIREVEHLRIDEGLQFRLKPLRPLILVDDVPVSFAADVVEREQQRAALVGRHQQLPSSFVSLHVLLRVDSQRAAGNLQPARGQLGDEDAVLNPPCRKSLRGELQPLCNVDESGGALSHPCRQIQILSPEAVHQETGITVLLSRHIQETHTLQDHLAVFVAIQVPRLPVDLRHQLLLQLKVR
mmetsp:Transcript_10318/g.29413  ORF Transcript_10318/g.29413 Transcript_10318/m.29413 type:complete len:489 (-) Transcript_10318:346-1812(-)